MEVIVYTLTRKPNIRDKKGVIHFGGEIFKGRSEKLLIETRSYFETNLSLLIYLLSSPVWNQITF